MLVVAVWVQLRLSQCHKKVQDYIKTDMVKGQHGAMALKQQLMIWQRFRHLNQQMYANLLILFYKWFLNRNLTWIGKKLCGWWLPLQKGTDPLLNILPSWWFVNVADKRTIWRWCSCCWQKQVHMSLQGYSGEGHGMKFEWHVSNNVVCNSAGGGWTWTGFDHCCWGGGNTRC